MRKTLEQLQKEEKSLTSQLAEVQRQIAVYATDKFTFSLASAFATHPALKSLHYSTDDGSMTVNIKDDVFDVMLDDFATEYCMGDECYVEDDAEVQAVPTLVEAANILINAQWPFIWKDELEDIFGWDGDYSGEYPELNFTITREEFEAEGFKLSNVDIKY